LVQELQVVDKLALGLGSEVVCMALGRVLQVVGRALVLVLLAGDKALQLAQAASSSPA
jgi:hypothetical protein